MSVESKQYCEYYGMNHLLNGRDNIKYLYNVKYTFHVLIQ